ncbi:unnamed protein product, partial [Closterium sp. NIES-53]
QFLQDWNTGWNANFDWDQRLIPNVFCEYDADGNLVFCETNTIEATICDYAYGITCDTSGMIVT